MKSASVQERMETVFRSVLGEPDLRISDELTAGDVPGWDSLAHVGLMFSLEAEFGLTFSDTELSLLDNVGELKQVIESRVVVVQPNRPTSDDYR